MFDEYIFKGCTIREDQDKAIKREKEKGFKFNLSKFLQFHLDEYFKSRKETELFMEEIKNEK